MTIGIVIFFFLGMLVGAGIAIFHDQMRHLRETRKMKAWLASNKAARRGDEPQEASHEEYL